MRPKSRNDFAIVIICALPLEADAVEALFDETYDRLGKHYDKQPGDANAYINGRIGKHHAVLCYLPGMGKGSAASVASSLRVIGRNPRFVGRQDEIHKLEGLMSIPDGAKKLAITGLGGVGKTQIALELAYRMRDREPECSIFWIPCTSNEAVEQAYISIAQVVGIQDVKPAEMKERIKAYFSQMDRKWLLIFDNADDMNMWVKDSSTALALRDFLPHSTQGHIIFTTRNRKLAVKLASSDVIHVRELNEKAGMEFLERSLIQESLFNDRHAVITLLEQLTFLPLAVTQAAAYMNENGVGVSDYLLLLEEQEADVVELLSEDFGDDGRYKDTQNPVAMTWLISFHQIQKLDKLASDYLSCMACVDPRNIPESFLPRPTSKKKMIDALGLLSAYSFIAIQPGNGFITLHRLVHLATRNWMKKEDQFSLYIRKAADRLSETFPHNDHTNRQLWREYLPHALFLLGANEFQERQEHYIDYIKNVGTCLASDGRYKEAEKLLVQVMETKKQMLGPEHSDTLTSMHNLASTYSNQGRWKEAEELSMQVMETQKQVLGPEHPSTLTSMANLAYTLKQLGKIPDALTLIKKCADLRNKVLGSYHSDAISSCDALSDWETAASHLLGNREQQTSANSPLPLPKHTYVVHQIESDSKPVAGGKRRSFIKFFRGR